MGDWAINGKPIASGWKINGTDVSTSNSQPINSDWGENAPTDTWSENPSQKPYNAPTTRIPTSSDNSDTGFDQTGEEAMLARGFRPDEIKRLGNQSGIPTILNMLKKGSFLGDASDTRMGREVTGLMDLPLGALQGLGHLTGNGERADAVMRLREQLIRENQSQDTRDQYVAGVDPLRFVGQMLTPLPGGAAGKGIAGLGKAVLRGGAIASAMPRPNVQYDEQGGGNYASQTAMDALQGGALGGVLYGGGSILSRLGQKKIITPAPGNVNELGSDIQSGLSSAAQDDLSNLQNIVNAGASKRQDAAQRLIDEIRVVGNDPTRQLQSSARTRLLLDKVSNDTAYAARDKAMEGLTTTTPRTVTAIDDEINFLKKNLYPGQEQTITKLEDFKSRLLGAEPNIQSSIVDEMGNPFPVSPNPPMAHGIDALSQTRSSVGKDVANMYTGVNDLTGKLGSDSATRISNALSDDISSAARLHGGDAQALDEAANAQYAAYKAKWGDNTLNKSLVNSNAPDELLSKFSQAGEDRSSNVREALTPAGHESIKSMMYQKLMNESEGDPGKFVKILKSMRGASNVFFDGSDKAKLDGLEKIMQTSSNIGNLSGPVAGATVGMAGGPLTMLGGAVGGGVLGKLHFGEGSSSSQLMSNMTKRLLSSDRGQQWLLQASKLQPHSPELQNLITTMMNEANMAGGVAVAEPDQPTIFNQLRGQ